jgi:hypothetical protein
MRCDGIRIGWAAAALAGKSRGGQWDEIDEHAWYDSQLTPSHLSESSDDPSACSANAQYVAAVGARIYIYIYIYICAAQCSAVLYSVELLCCRCRRVVTNCNCVLASWTPGSHIYGVLYSPNRFQSDGLGWDGHGTSPPPTVTN